MKKLFKLFILAMLAVCGVACEPNDLVGGKTTFAISVTNITTTGATIDVVPSNNHTYYYFDVVQKIYFEEYSIPEEEIECVIKFGEKSITVIMRGREFTISHEDFPESFRLGFTACEGFCEFTSYEIKTPDQN